MVKIKGDKFKAVVIDDSDITVTVDKKAHLYGGGNFDGSDLFPTYGLVEDVAASPSGNTYKINGHVRGLLGGVTTFGDDTTIKLGKTADVSATIGIGIGSLDFSDPSVLENISLGSVSASGDDSRIIISKGATVGGLIGTSILGGNSSITNSGDLSGSLVGMIAGDLGTLIGGLGGAKQAAAPSADTTLTNNGHIDATIGMISIGLGGDTEINNGKNGELIAGFLGVGAIDITGTGHTEFNNAGTIRVTMNIPELVLPIPGLSSSAYFSIGSEDHVNNSGKIYGNIFLGDGDDVMTNRGKIAGKVYGSTGDDTYIVGSSKDKFVELDGEGNKDTVKSAFNYTLSDFVEQLILTGKGDIDGTGNSGANILIGNKGDNVLTGGLGMDTFEFSSKGGHDTIADFTLADDTLDLSGWKGMVDLTFLGDHAEEKNGDVVITVGKDVLVIADHALADLDTANIIYAV